MDGLPTSLQPYNAAVDLIERNLDARPNKIAYIDEQGSYSFGELAQRVNRAANALTNLGLPMESRVMVALLDTIDRQGGTLQRLTTRQASLEDVFVNLTGRHLRDE